MTKAEIIDAVYETVGGLSKKEAAEIVEAVYDTMKEVLTQGEKIKISGFGNFIVRSKNERMGRNPRTGDPIPICARRVLKFKASKVLRDRLNPEKEQLKRAAGDALPDDDPSDPPTILAEDRRAIATEPSAGHPGDASPAASTTNSRSDLPSEDMD